MYTVINLNHEVVYRGVLPPRQLPQQQLLAITLDHSSDHYNHYSLWSLEPINTKVFKWEHINSIIMEKEQCNSSSTSRHAAAN